MTRSVLEIAAIDHRDVLDAMTPTTAVQAAPDGSWTALVARVALADVPAVACGRCPARYLPPAPSIPVLLR